MNGAFPADSTRVFKCEEFCTFFYDSSANAAHGTITSGTFVSDVPTKKRQAVGGNMIYNGDFEFAPPFVAATSTSDRIIDGTAAGSTTNTLFGSWIYTTYAGTGEAQFDSTVKYSGNNSIKLVSVNARNGISLVNPTTNPIPADLRPRLIRIEPSTSYTISLYIKTLGVDGGNALVRVVEVNGSGVPGTATNVGFATGTTDWTLKTVTFTSTATARYLNIWVKSIDAGTTNGSIWVDNITLTKTTPETRTAITGAAVPNYNYITNPSFEVDTSGWGGTGTGSTLTRDTSVFHSGVASGKMETSADNQWVSFPLGVPPSTQITLSAWVKGTAGELIHLNFWTGAVDVPGGPFTLTGEWQRIAHTLTTAASGIPEFQVRRYAGDSANPVWIDDASAVWGAA